MLIIIEVNAAGLYLEGLRFVSRSVYHNTVSI
jgi:hypothetical protein